MLCTDQVSELSISWCEYDNFTYQSQYLMNNYYLSMSPHINFTASAGHYTFLAQDIAIHIYCFENHILLDINVCPGSITKQWHTPENGLTCQDPEENSQCPYFNYNITQTGAGCMKATVKTSIEIQHRGATAPYK